MSHPGHELSYWYDADQYYQYQAAQQAAFLDPQGGLVQVVQTVPVETDEGAAIASSSGSAAATSYDHPVAGLVDMTWAQHPHRVLWAARSDGLLVGLTLMPEQNIAAWHRHPLQNGVVESVCTVPSPEDGADRVWAIVRRRINDDVVRYVEYMTAPHQPASVTDTDGFCHVDSSIIYDGEPTSVITGLDHLEGQTVAVWGDGADCGDYEVDGGSITLAKAVSYASIGLHSPARIVMLPLDAGHGDNKVIERATMRVEATGGLAYASPSSPTMRAMPMRRASDSQDVPTPIFTGEIAIRPDTGWETSGQMAFGAIRPYPSTILAVAFDVHVASG